MFFLNPAREALLTASLYGSLLQERGSAGCFIDRPSLQIENCIKLRRPRQEGLRSFCIMSAEIFLLFPGCHQCDYRDEQAAHDKEKRCLRNQGNNICCTIFRTGVGKSHDNKDDDSAAGQGEKAPHLVDPAFYRISADTQETGKDGKDGRILFPSDRGSVERDAVYSTLEQAGPENKKCSGEYSTVESNGKKDICGFTSGFFGEKKHSCCQVKRCCEKHIYSHWGTSSFEFVIFYAFIVRAGCRKLKHTES